MVGILMRLKLNFRKILKISPNHH